MPAPSERRRVRIIGMSLSHFRALFIGNPLSRHNIKVLITTGSIVTEVLGAHTFNIRCPTSRGHLRFLYFLHTVELKYVPRYRILGENILFFP